MRLADDEKRMRDGADGDAVAAAMDQLATDSAKQAHDLPAILGIGTLAECVDAALTGHWRGCMR